jgi:hypothetical protein
MEDVIKQGLLTQKKQAFRQAVLDGKAALQALLNEAVFAKDRSVEEMNVDSLQSHLNQLKAKKAECVALISKIKEFE